LVINEVMYHPVSGCPEFIELYNRSTHAFNLGDFRIGLKDIYSTDLKTISDIFPENRLFMPGEYIVLTSYANRMNDCYPHTLNNAVAEFRGIPALTDDGQKLQILSKDLSVIDEMSYKDAMQFALLSNSIGVSLERVNYDRSSKDPGNWHSASSASGYCTPGYQNSQFTDAENSENILRIEPEVFSPNNDGIADIVNISYCFKEPGFTGNLFVYDSKGRQVRRLANNELLASKGQFSWDGTSDSGSMAEPGIYIVCFEVFNLSGKTGRYKKVCVISRTR